MCVFNLSLQVDGHELYSTETTLQSAVRQISETMIGLIKTWNQHENIRVVCRSYKPKTYTIWINDTLFSRSFQTEEEAKLCKEHLELDACDGTKIALKCEMEFVNETIYE